jgi:hypothetical protein
LRDILKGEDRQVAAVVSVVRAAAPDVLVLAGVDWDLEGHALTALGEAIGGYPHRFAARPNRGLDSGLDLDGDGRLGTPDDAHGFAEFAGQEGLAVLSRLALDTAGFREFTGMDWSDLPGAIRPEGTLGLGRLSTTAHWDLPLVLPGGGRLHLLVWHATPPVFDGPEDRNGRRNHDETAFWLRYIEGAFGPPPRDFVLLGAANLDPLDGEGRAEALTALLAHPLVRDVAPRSAGGASAPQGGVNARHRGDPALDTTLWPDGPGKPGNMRVDYVLPSATFKVLDAGVFWPAPGASLSGDVEAASRHRLVWVDIAFEPDPERGGDGGARIGGPEAGQQAVEFRAVEPVGH